MLLPLGWASGLELRLIFSGNKLVAGSGVVTVLTLMKM